MSGAYLGEIRMFGGNYQPVNWMFCDGRTLFISQNSALFALLGTTYGGNGSTTFNLPDMRGRIPLHQGNGAGLTPRTIGQQIGTELETLNSLQIPAHSHAVNASTSAGNTIAPGTGVITGVPVDPGATPTMYVIPGTSTVNPAAMATGSLSSTGGSQAHSNMMPTLAVNYIICVNGIFPSRN